MVGTLVTWHTPFSKEWVESLNLEILQDGIKGELIVLVASSQTQKSFQIEFPGTLSYRVTSEEFESDSDSPLKPLPAESSVSFIWEDSRWVTEMRALNRSMAESSFSSKDISHYFVCGLECSIEVIAALPPVIREV